MKVFSGFIFLATPLFGMFYAPETGIDELDKVCSAHGIITKNENPNYQHSSFIDPKKETITFDIKHFELSTRLLDRVLADFKALSFVRKVEYISKKQLIQIRLNKGYFGQIKKESFIEKGKMDNEQLKTNDYR